MSQKHDSDSDVVLESSLIQDLLKRRHNKSAVCKNFCSMAYSKLQQKTPTRKTLSKLYVADIFLFFFHYTSKADVNCEFVS